MSAIAKALADSQRSLLACKAAVTHSPADIMASSPGGFPGHRPDLMHAAEQLRHFTGLVYTSIRPIASKIAGQPIHVGRAKGSPVSIKSPSDIEPLESHELLKLFSDPNPLQVAWSLMFVTVASLELTGRQLWWLPQRKAIYPIPTPWIKSFEGTTRFTAFNVAPPGTGEPFPIRADECVYFSYPSPHDPHGAISPLQAVAGAVDSDEEIVRSQAAMFRRGINPQHAVVVGKNPHADFPQGIRPRLSAGQERQIVDAIQRRYGAVQNHGSPLILDGLIEDVKVLSNTPKEMDYLKSGDFAKQRIMLGFGVNGIVCGQIESANRASSDNADRHFIDYTVNPKIELLSQTMTSWLRVVFNDPTLIVWIEKPVANDAETSLKWTALLAQYGSITGDEMRSLTPFGLETGKFPDPVSPGKTQAEKSLDEATAGLEKAVDELIPSRTAGKLLAEIEHEDQ